MKEANFDKLLIPGEFALKIFLWMIEMTPDMLDDSIRFAIALGLSLIVWAWGFRVCLELLKNALGIGSDRHGGY
jgi:hypothetical protein